MVVYVEFILLSVQLFVSVVRWGLSNVSCYSVQTVRCFPEEYSVLRYFSFLVIKEDCLAECNRPS